MRGRALGAAADLRGLAANPFDHFGAKSLPVYIFSMFLHRGHSFAPRVLLRVLWSAMTMGLQSQSLRLRVSRVSALERTCPLFAIVCGAPQSASDVGARTDRGAFAIAL